MDVYVRFAHEMNGSWYAWGEQPAEYVRAFRVVADAVHQRAPRSQMVWAPSYAGGYPFAGGKYEAHPGTIDFAALDTDHDGKLTMRDDPYAPYYPGDAYVDWVGLTDYFWGNTWPWGQNQLPPPGKFVAQLTGKDKGPNGDEDTLPDFYATYAEGHNKPFVLAETAALYNPTRSDGASSQDIKLAWANQVFAGVAEHFPKTKMVLWFEYNKHESDTGTPIDWQATDDPAVLDGFRNLLPPWLVFAR